MRVAFLLHDEFQDDSLRRPLEALTGAGHRVHLIGPTAGRVYTGRHLRERLTAEAPLDLAEPADFDALYIPGGYAPEKLRLVRGIEGFVRSFMLADKPLATICRGPQLLISADVVRGRRLTCHAAIAVDVRNAGGIVIDRPVVVDRRLLSARRPGDLAAFCEAFIAVIEGRAYEPEQPTPVPHPGILR